MGLQRRLRVLIQVTLFIATAAISSAQSVRRGGAFLRPATLLGTHGGSDVVSIESLGAQAVRMIVFDQQVAAAIHGTGSAFFNKLLRFKADGLETIVTIRWPSDPQDSEGRDRVPTGQDRIDSLQLLADFLAGSDGVVDWYQIQNEPMGGPGRYALLDQQAGLAWMMELADTARGHITLNGLRQRILAPAITGIPGAMEGNPQSIAAIDLLIDLAAHHTDALDLHLHVRDSADLRARIQWLKMRLVQQDGVLPLTCTEWSQADAMGQWLLDNPNWKQFEIASYTIPVSLGEWAAYMAATPLDPSFLPRSYRVANAFGLLHLCYGGLWQHGSAAQPHPKFDSDALLLNLTVVHAPGGPEHNEPLFSAYRNLAQGL